MNEGTALAALHVHFLAWAWFPYSARRPPAQRAYLKSLARALIKHDRILLSDPRNT
jgi:hypothetical protein